MKNLDHSNVDLIFHLSLKKILLYSVTSKNKNFSFHFQIDAVEPTTVPIQLQHGTRNPKPGVAQAQVRRGFAAAVRGHVEGHQRLEADQQRHHRRRLAAGRSIETTRRRRAAAGRSEASRRPTLPR